MEESRLGIGGGDEESGEENDEIEDAEAIRIRYF